MPEIRGMFRAHQENNIAAPRRELTIPGPLEFAIPSRNRVDGKGEGW